MYTQIVFFLSFTDFVEEFELNLFLKLGYKTSLRSLNVRLKANTLA